VATPAPDDPAGAMRPPPRGTYRFSSSAGRGATFPCALHRLHFPERSPADVESGAGARRGSVRRLAGDAGIAAVSPRRRQARGAMRGVGRAGCKAPCTMHESLTRSAMRLAPRAARRAPPASASCTGAPGASVPRGACGGRARAWHIACSIPGHMMTLSRPPRSRHPEDALDEACTVVPAARGRHAARARVLPPSQPVGQSLSTQRHERELPARRRVLPCDDPSVARRGGSRRGLTRPDSVLALGHPANFRILDNRSPR